MFIKKKDLQELLFCFLTAEVKHLKWVFEISPNSKKALPAQAPLTRSVYSINRICSVATYYWSSLDKHLGGLKVNKSGSISIWLCELFNILLVSKISWRSEPKISSLGLSTKFSFKLFSISSFSMICPSKLLGVRWLVKAKGGTKLDHSKPKNKFDPVGSTLLKFNTGLSSGVEQTKRVTLAMRIKQLVDRSNTKKH